MTNDNTRTKANAVFFSALMVISMVAVGFAAAPAAAVNVTDGDRMDVDGGTAVGNGSSVYQGEENLFFYDDTGQKFEASDLEGTSGNREGTPLQMPIPEDQETGTYADNADGSGFSVTVVQPRITTAEVRNNGSTDDISQIATSNADDLKIYAEWNFDDAENVSVEVTDPNGDEITGEVVEGPTELNNTGENTSLNLQTEDAGEYTVTFEGANNLDYDSVVQEYTIETTSQDQLSIDTAEDSVTRGDNLQYTLSGGTNGDEHVVAIDAGDFRDGVSYDNAEDIFRNVQDVNATGVYNGTDTPNEMEYAYATVEIDGTQGVGSIETAYLDDSSIDVNVYEESSVDDTSNLTSADDVSFDVEEGEVSLNSPTDTYTVGSEVDINGTAQSADEVAIYARDNSDWELLNISGDAGDVDKDYISVDSDDSFEEEDVRLSSASNIFSFEGQYDIGVVDTSDLSSEDVDDPSELTTSQFSSASSARYTLSVQPGDLTANFGTINGQIDSVDAEIDVEGTAAGQDEVVIAFVGERGDTVTTTATVDSDETFEEEDISLDDISQGSVSGHVISPGRDGEYGDEFGSDAQTVAGEIESFGDGSSTGDQIRSQILSNTVDDTGSDDLIVNQNFRLNDPTLSINDVYPEQAEASGINPVATGETLVVGGDTNRQPDNAAITLELLTQEDDSVASASTDEWGSDGQWNASFDTSDVETGTYILEADDGESTDRVNVEIVEEREDPSDGDDDSSGDDSSGDDSSGDDSSGDDSSGDDSSGDDTSGDDSSGDDSSGDDTSGDDSSGDDSSGDGSTEDGTPGFGALVALVALIAAALLATRRDN
ncbi:major cell surface glycoprotein [Halorubrum sp. GN11_10-6_MGM]|uniref:HVO_2072 family ArtA-dependent S-layer glycoprotein n=1 Tax=Halorubrum sp. GN11_10-6_MGM TaxID=2518112 RepID=UPI0010F85D32|nr:HVO_2072 family ArtA-dependent S-layer glycoprotein [Halorubrum sp. GN11_10-6_MGM]TKX74451.1 major cell surface glycoprotein [Halorubrum sp. GN11_10-6_MGM]